MPIMGGISNVARNLKGMVGVNNVARKINKGFYGDENGVAREFYSSYSFPKVVTDIPVTINHTVNYGRTKYQVFTASECAEALDRGATKLIIQGQANYTMASSQYGTFQLWFVAVPWNIASVGDPNRALSNTYYGSNTYPTSGTLTPAINKVITLTEQQKNDLRTNGLIYVPETDIDINVYTILTNTLITFE